MRSGLYLLFTIHLLFTSAAVFSQSARVSVSKEPAWVTRNIIDYTKTALDKDAADGYIDISFEKQVYLADQSQYVRSSKKIISQAGVQNGSEITVAFDPSYEQLIFHDIHITRKGEILNRLQLSKIKTVHQETELANFIYNGSVNAVLVLEDVRQGDIIEFSYTIKGFNPIFKNKFAGDFSLAYSVPMYELYYKLVVPAGRKINIKNLNESLQPVISAANGQQVYEWRKTNVSPMVLQDYTPSWYDPYPQVLLSEYSDWKEVINWAMELFPVKKALSADVQKKIKEIESEYPGNGERVKAALRFVQDDIRYMGIEMGENSHRPADPSKIFAQRFGDCKEKSYLLCCMLRAMDIDASPVLINTTIKKNLNNLLPAPTDFDHATVRVKLDNKYYWFDPTIAYQRGAINDLFYPDYQAGLVVSDSSVSLTPIVFKNNSNQHVKEYFKVRAMSGGGSLTVTTTYKGVAADEARSSMNSESISELMTSYQKFYAAYYEDIKADSLNYTDDDSTGVFITREYYTIPNFWTADKTKGSRFIFSSFIINTLVRRPKEKERKMPFHLSFPTKFQEEVIVELPNRWQVTESEAHLKNSSFNYNYKFFCLYNIIRLETSYETFKDHSTIEEAPEYFRDLGKYDDIGSFEITSGTSDLAGNSSTNSGITILIIVLFIGALVGGVIWRSRRK